MSAAFLLALVLLAGCASSQRVAEDPHPPAPFPAAAGEGEMPTLTPRPTLQAAAAEGEALTPEPPVQAAGEKESASTLPATSPTAEKREQGSPTSAALGAPSFPTTIALAEGTPAPELDGKLVAQTAHLDIYRLGESVPVTRLLELAPRFEEAIGRVGAKIGGELTGRVALRFEPPQQGPCALRGLTTSHERTIRMFYGPQTPPERLLAIAAHELAHQTQHDYYGWPAHQRSDTILLEGQATWASGDYALGEDGRPTWQAAAEQALADGRLLPLDADLEADCRTTTRNTAYTGWASFVAYLMTFGRERFDALYRSEKGRAPGSADYARVYGKSMAQLDREWREWLAESQR